MRESGVRYLMVTLCALPLGACGGGGSGPDVVDQDTMMATMDGGGDDADDMDTGRRARDVANTEVVLADTIGSCYVGIAPTQGSASATFVATGSNYTQAMLVATIYSGSAASNSCGGTMGLIHSDMITATSDGSGAYSFTYNIPTSSLAVGTYTLCVRDTLFTCTFKPEFQITP